MRTCGRVFAVAAMLMLTAMVASAVAASAAVSLSPIEQLGKHLLFDTNLSSPPGQSCAACHAPEVGFTGPDSDINAGGAVYEGAVAGRFGNRKPPAASYGGDSPILYFDQKAGTFVGGMFWDGRATGWTLGDPLAEQAEGPFLNPAEQNMPSAAAVVTAVAASSYADLFIAVWGPGSLDPADPVAYERIARSIAAYERSSEVSAFTSKYDYYLKGMVKLTKQERQGLKLFGGQGKCAKCHVLKPVGPKAPTVLTDFTYDNLGLPKNPQNPFYNMPYNPDGANWIDPGLGGFLQHAGYPETVVAANWGKHKVPTLRNVDKRPYPGFVKAFGHNGYFKSLEEIVHFYNTRDVATWPPPEVAANVNTKELGNLGLTAAEEAAIVAFMKTLSDGYVLPAAGKAESVTLVQPGLELKGPNPFNPSTSFSYTLAQPGEVTIAVFDVAGRKVATLVNGWSAEGQYTIDWTARGLPSGQYSVCMWANGMKSLRRVTLIK